MLNPTDTTGKQLLDQLEFLLSQVLLHQKRHYFYLDDEMKEEIIKGIDVLQRSQLNNPAWELNQSEIHSVDALLQLKSDLLESGVLS